MPRILVVDDSATIRKIVERTLARAGYEVMIAASGQEGLEHAQRAAPDLVLLDFVMPKMNGYQLTQALRAIDNLRDVPIVLMSARAERIADQFIAQTGAVDALAKPFSPEALLAVTAHALERGAREYVPAVLGDSELAAATPSRFPPRATGTTDVRGGSSPDLLAAARKSALAMTARRLAEGIAPALRAAAGVPGADRTAGADAKLDDASVAAAIGTLSEEALIRLVADAAMLAPSPAGVTAIEGRIEHAALGDALQMLQLQAQTGVLEVERGSRAVSIQLRNGNVDLAVARGADPEFLLGRYLLEEEVIEREDLDVLLRNKAPAGTPRRLLGDQLVKLGYITEEDLRRALVRQTSELMYEVLRWRDGRYRFVKWAMRPEAESANLGLPIATVLMEGLRRVDEWRLIEEQIHDFDMIFERDPHALAAVDTDALSREERLVLSAIDGKRAVRDVVAETHMGSFDACKALFQFATSRLVRRAR